MKNALAIVLSFFASVALAQTPDSTVYELRVYKAAEGKREVLVSLLQNEIGKLLSKHGMKPYGFWTAADSNKVIYVVIHKSKLSMTKSWKDFYADASWSSIKDKLTVDGKVVSDITSIPMRGAGILPDAASSSKSSPMLFEMRTYFCLPNRLPNLIARFKAKTTSLFVKHHMDNIAYWTTIESDGTQPKLVYILTHQNKDAQTANWASFRADPEWISFRDASEKDGKIVEKVVSVSMNAFQ